jgi:hypothetical protein
MGRMKDLHLSIECAIANHPDATDTQITDIVVKDCDIDDSSVPYVLKNVKRIRFELLNEEHLKP